jgi:hypothetical protein
VSEILNEKLPYARKEKVPKIANKNWNNELVANFLREKSHTFNYCGAE